MYSIGRDYGGNYVEPRGTAPELAAAIESAEELVATGVSGRIIVQDEGENEVWASEPVFS